jgi:predicted secreted protein
MLKFSKALLIVSLLIITLIALTSFNTIFAGETSTDVIKVDINSNNSTVSLQPGQQLELTLDSNPSTGYSWAYATEFDTKVITELSSTYIEPTSGLVGATGQNVWTYKALAVGKTTIQLNYLRSWEENSTIKTFTLNIEVVEAPTENDVVVTPSITIKNDTTQFKISIKNNSESNITINHPSGQKFDFVLQSSENKDLYTWSDDMNFTQALTTTSIPAGKTVNLKVSAKVDKSILDNSKYLVAYICGSSDDFKISENGYKIEIN